MEFLQKLIAIPKNVLMSLKLLQQKKQQIQMSEPIKISEDCKIETFEMIDYQKLIKKNKNVDKQIQTDIVKTNTKRLQNIQKNNKNNEKLSKKQKKKEKLNEKQDQNLSETSEQTKPSQYSYCQNNFLEQFELNEKQINLENVESFYPAKRKSVQQTPHNLFNNYINKITLELSEKELHIMKQNTGNTLKINS